MMADRRLAAATLPEVVAELIAATAKAALLAELNTWPKPGLVSHVDCGSHTDMDARSFEASADAIAPFFAELATAGAGGAAMPELRRIGVAAERAMLAATDGVNTHRGAIFGLGLLCAAAGVNWQMRGAGAAWRPLDLADLVRVRWGRDILGGPIPLHSHGTDAWRRFRAGGARAQAAEGFPTALAIGLPALSEGRLLAPGDPQAARVHAFFALLGSMEDTNLLHRGGAEGLRFARRHGAAFLECGGVAQAHWSEAASVVHTAFIARRLSPGGCADLLAICLFLDALGGPA